MTHTFGEPELFAGGWDESGYVNGSGVTARFDIRDNLLLIRMGICLSLNMDDILFVKLLQQVRFFVCWITWSSRIYGWSSREG
mgnify:CR=1 FL=1